MEQETMELTAKEILKRQEEHPEELLLIFLEEVHDAEE